MKSKEDRKRIGEYFARYRKSHGWTLEKISQMTGVSIPTLSKVETKGQISFDTLFRLVHGLGLSFSDVFDAKGVRPNFGGRLTVTRGGEAQRFSTEQYDYELHACAIRGKEMVTLVMHLKTSDISEIEHWSSHEGEECVIVLEGAAVMHSEGYAPLELAKGDSVYFDSSMAHAFVAANRDGATILSMCAGPGIKKVDEVGCQAIRDEGGLLPV